MSQQKIVPHLWFDAEAKEAAEFYTSVFGGASQVTDVTTLHDTPSGDADVVSFELAGQKFMAISAGPLFKINPSISFFVWCESAEEVEALWQKLSDEGEALMPLDSYPFSKRYGWIQDKYGVSWQLTFVDEKHEQKITPCLMFADEQHGNAEEAIQMYTDIFPDGRIDAIERYTAEQGPEGMVVHGRFTIGGLGMTAMDSHEPNGFTFNEAVSLMVYCEDQEEIDYYWEKLSAVPEAEQCGWLKDKYGVSWQIVPEAMDEMMRTGTPEQVKRVTEAFLKMKKFDLATLQEAYENV